MAHWRTALAVAAFSLLGSCGQRGQVSAPASGTSAVAGGPTVAQAADFEQRVQEFAKLNQNATARISKLPDKAEPEQIVAHEQALRSALRQAWPHDKPGQFFTPAIAEHFRQVIKREVSGPEGRKVLAHIREDMPAKNPARVPAKINEPYPDGVPLSTVPPELLKKLPQLPPELDYRFAGRDLILRATNANVIVDYIPNVLPLPGTAPAAASAK